MAMTPVAILALLAGALLAVLGIAVLVLRGRNLAVAAFGGMALVFAASNTGTGLTAAGYVVPLWVKVVISLGQLASIGILMFAFPTRLRFHDIFALLIACSVGMVHGGAKLAALIPQGSEYLAAPAGTDSSVMFSLRAVSFLMYSGGVAAFMMLPLRARRLPANATGHARSLAVISVGLALFLVANARFIVFAAEGSTPLVPALMAVFFTFIPATLAWALAARGAHPALARRVALALATIFTIASIMAVFNVPLLLPAGGLVGVLILGYGVLRGHFDGLDLKVRFALSKSTIAAVFIAVFFVASEVAQQFFGDRLGSTYVGIAAAGMLVFAIAPLQRAAERLAVKAVPIGPSAYATPNWTDEQETFRVTVRKFLRDGTVSRDEERHLARLATRLGIDAERAMALRDEIEAEPTKKVKRA